MKHSTTVKSCRHVTGIWHKNYKNANKGNITEQATCVDLFAGISHFVEQVHAVSLYNAFVIIIVVGVVQGRPATSHALPPLGQFI